MPRYKIVLGIVLMILGGGFLFKDVFLPRDKPVDTGSQPPSQSDKPQIISTKPEPLEEAIVAADQVIEITFNRPLENVGEFKVRIEPEVEYKLELSGDRKTAKIIPIKPLELSTTYTIFIGPDTKFDGVGNWGQDKIFHIQTIKYRGI